MPRKAPRRSDARHAVRPAGRPHEFAPSLAQGGRNVPAGRRSPPLLSATAATRKPENVTVPA